MRRRPAERQLIDLERLQFDRHQSAACVAFLEQDTAIDLLSADRHAEHLAEALLTGHIAVFRLAPVAPERFDLSVQLFLAGFRLQSEAAADNVADERRDQTVHHIRIAFQITGTCANGVAAGAVGHFRRFDQRRPSGVEPPVIACIVAVALHIVQTFAEHRTPARRFR